jgi:hypothetical protein
MINLKHGDTVQFENSNQEVFIVDDFFIKQCCPSGDRIGENDNDYYKIIGKVVAEGKNYYFIEM